jgi:FkbM family methyltransferase
MQKATLHRAAHQNFPTQQASHAFLWSLYRSALTGVHATGILRLPLGKKLYAAFNRVARTGLRTYLVSLHTRPVNVRGHQMRLAHRESTNLGLTLKMLLGVYEPGTTQLIESTVKPGMIVVDVGAHAGYYTLLAARLAGPEGKVYAFEADPANYRLLIENIELNAYTNIHAVPQAVAGSTGRLSFYISPWGSDRNSLYQDNTGPEARRVEVDAVTLDDFMARLGRPAIDLIKMDIEGAEFVALEGMKETLEKTRKLIIEFSPAALQAGHVKPEDLLNRLSRFGFGFSVIEDDGDLKPRESVDFPALIDALAKGKDVVNLFCEKTEALMRGASAGC